MSSNLVKVISQPRLAWSEGWALLKGWWCRVWCRVRGIHLKAGRNLRIEGRLVIRGPGTVILGDNVRIAMTVTPWTYHRDAVISIGDDSYVNGTSFGCRQRITIGRRAILGRSYLMDTDFHSIQPNRHDADAEVRVMPIVVGENVWIGANAGILPGSHIGANSVVGFGAVCSGTFPADVVIAGNPAHVVREISGPGGSSESRGRSKGHESPA